MKSAKKEGGKEGGGPGGEKISDFQSGFLGRKRKPREIVEKNFKK